MFPDHPCKEFADMMAIKIATEMFCTIDYDYKLNCVDWSKPLILGSP